jgi:hypothetical protein
MPAKGHEPSVGVTAANFRVPTQTGYYSSMCGLLFGDTRCWSILMAGRHRMSVCTMATDMRKYLNHAFLTINHVQTSFRYISIC